MKSFMEMLKEIQESDIVICFSRNGIKAIKHRFGDTDKQLSLDEVLEIIIEYQNSIRDAGLHKLIKSEVKKIVNRLNGMKAFW